MKALLVGSKGGGGGDKASVTVIANGKKATTFNITPEDNDVMRQIDLKEFVKAGDNDIRLEYQGEGSLLYQVVGRYYTPWERVEAPRPPPAVTQQHEPTPRRLLSIKKVSRSLQASRNPILSAPEGRLAL